MNTKILIVGTVPYNKKMTSRAFAAYFGGWERNDLAQIFSNPNEPLKGQCGKLYQITDSRLLKHRFNHSIKIAKQFEYSQLKDETEAAESCTQRRSIIRTLYKIGSRKNSFTCLLRKWLWRKKDWCTGELNSWLDEFAPECVFLSFSDDFFIPEIALYVAERYNIPIVSSIGDDYYFNDKFSLSPLYHIYRSKYKKLIRSILNRRGSAIFISDKIRDKYNSEFDLDGETVYLASEIERKPFKTINKEMPSIYYFGNIRQGRNESLNDIGMALGAISKNYVLKVYSGQQDKDVVAVFNNNPNVDFCGTIPYTEVIEKTADADILVIVEGFKKKHINATKYSLSTKVADSIASGNAILAYGSSECGAIEYLQNTNCAAVCTDKKKLIECIEKLISDEEYQRENYCKAIDISRQNHNEVKSREVFERVIEKAQKGYECYSKL